MATYERVIRETGRFNVVDAEDRQSTVIEYTTFFLRVSLHKEYSPKKGDVSYRLADGRAVNRTQGGHFDVGNGLCRFFAVGDGAGDARLGWATRGMASDVGVQCGLH
ncbi:MULTISPECIES: hypothetical protein [unclassified Variovorax]|uniref:hypothetical protein n=1 Tax=unclassified Variovorax TaxID=663243 RepID=UPI0008C0467D|nr:MULTISPECIES: hypothetical protein [unclassified Variovorax]SEK07221.1 hypothetical protein SAMN05518853_107286 [Variovorax sp. OK202]SFD49635.1 hypothetical protein SAMN05444746_107286 [Variovorax sp. OK212]